MERIDYLEHERDWIGFALMELVGKKWKEIIRPETKTTFEVEIKLNGVEVKFSHLIEVMEKQYDRQVREAALELLKDKFETMTDALYKLEREVEWRSKEILDLYVED